MSCSVTSRREGPKKEKRKREDGGYAELGDESQGPWATEKAVVKEEVSDVDLKEAVQEEMVGDTGKEKEEEEKEKPNEEKVDRLMHIVEPDEEEEMWEKVNERKINRTLPPRPDRGSTISEVGGMVCVSWFR